MNKSVSNFILNHSNKIILIVISIWMYLRFFDSHPGDFEVYYVAIERLLNNQEIYQISDLNPFKYLPHFLLPIYLLPKTFNSAWQVFLAFTLLIWSCSIYLFTRKYSASPLALPLAIALTFHGLIETLAYGQVDMVLHSVSLLCLMGFENKSINKKALPILGVLAAYCILTKPPIGLLYLSVIFSRSVRHLFTGGIFWLIASVLFFGIQHFYVLCTHWIKLLKDQHTPEYLTGNMAQNLSGVISRITDTTQQIQLIQNLTYGITLLLILAFVFHFKKKHGSNPRYWHICIPAFFILNPISYRTIVFIFIPVLASLISEFQTAGIKRHFGKLSLLGFVSFASTHAFADLTGINWETINFYGIWCAFALILFFLTLNSLQLGQKKNEPR